MGQHLVVGFAPLLYLGLLPKDTLDRGVIIYEIVCYKIVLLFYYGSYLIFHSLRILGGDCWKWCSGKILANSALLSRCLYQSLQKDHRSGLSGKTPQVTNPLLFLPGNRFESHFSISIFSKLFVRES